MYWLHRKTGNLLTAYQIREKFKEEIQGVHSMQITVRHPNIRDIWEMERLEGKGRWNERIKESLSDQREGIDWMMKPRKSTWRWCQDMQVLMKTHSIVTLPVKEIITEIGLHAWIGHHLTWSVVQFTLITNSGRCWCFWKHLKSVPSLNNFLNNFLDTIS